MNIDLEGIEKNIGFTNDWNEACWILPDGRMVKRKRSGDHRRVLGFIVYEGECINPIILIREAGWVRVMPEDPGIEFNPESRLTQQQKDVIHDIGLLISDLGTEFHINDTKIDSWQLERVAYSIDDPEVVDQNWGSQYDENEIVIGIRVEHMARYVG